MLANVSPTSLSKRDETLREFPDEQEGLEDVLPEERPLRLNGKNESDVRTGLTSVCQLLYFPISCFFTSPYWCTLSPNSPIDDREERDKQ